ncbi:hypothetical protein [Rhodopseudomonas parapalustris]
MNYVNIAHGLKNRTIRRLYAKAVVVRMQWRIIWKKERIDMKNNLLKKGDKVVMHTCIEAETYNGKIWTCRTDEYMSGGKNPYGLIFLEGFCGSFATEYLQKVNIEQEHESLRHALSTIMNLWDTGIEDDDVQSFIKAYNEEAEDEECKIDSEETNELYIAREIAEKALN